MDAALEGASGNVCVSHREEANDVRRSTGLLPQGRGTAPTQWIGSGSLCPTQKGKDLGLLRF